MPSEGRGGVPRCAVRGLCDNNASGLDPTAPRPELERCITDIRAGQVVGVVAHEQSRITRQPEVWEQFIVTLTVAKIEKVHTVQNGIIAVGEGNRLVGRFLKTSSTPRRRSEPRPGPEPPTENSWLLRVARRAIDPMAIAKPRSPKWATTATRRSVGPHLEIDEAEAEVIRFIADQILAGYGVTTIAKQLNAKGVPPWSQSRKNKDRIAARWYKSTVHHVITNHQSPGCEPIRARPTPAR